MANNPPPKDRLVKIDKELGVNISLSALIAILTVGGLIWAFVKPAISDAVAEELKDSIRQEVQSAVAAETAPVSMAFAVMLQSTVNRLRREIAAMEFREAAYRGGDTSVSWTLQDAQDLSDKRAEMATAQMALTNLGGSQ